MCEKYDFRLENLKNVHSVSPYNSFWEKLKLPLRGFLSQNVLKATVDRKSHQKLVHCLTPPSSQTVFKFHFSMNKFFN